MSWWPGGNARRPMGPQAREAGRPDRRPLGLTRAGVGPAPSSGTFIGRLVVIFGTGANTGLFVYNGTPGLGTLVAQIVAPGTTKDPYGNSVTAVANFGKWSGAGSIQQHFGIDSNGDTYLTTSTGAIVVRAHSSSGAMWFYNTSGQGLNNILASIAPAAGTDVPGNAIVQGIAAYASGTPAVNVQLTAGAIQFNQASINTAALVSSNNAAPLILGSGKVNSTDVQSGITLTSVAAGGVGVAELGGCIEFEETTVVPVADGSSAAGPKAFGNSSGHLGIVADSLNGDGNTYDTERLTLISPGVTINSNVTPVTVFTHHLGVGKYYVRVWMVVANTTAADAASWGFAGSGGLVATGPMDFTSKTSGTATVGYGASGAFTTTFNNQGVAGSQGIEMQTTVTVTTAGTFNLQGLELVAGNTVTVAAGATMMIYPVVAT